MNRNDAVPGAGFFFFPESVSWIAIMRFVMQTFSFCLEV